MKSKYKKIGDAKLMSFALMSFFASSLAFAVGVADNADDLTSTTLGEDSAYTLVDAGGNSATLEATKYLIETDSNGDVSYSEVLYAVDIKNLILDEAGTNYIYFTWEKSATNNNITLTNLGDSKPDLEDYEYFYVQYSDSLSASSIYLDYSKSSDTVSIAGGAIYNVAALNDIEASFVGNSTSTSATGASTIYIVAYGGAIYNSSTINDITGDFIANYASTSSYYTMARGGAIYNSGDIASVTGDFINNYVYASSTSYAYVYGGAIYNTGSLAITGDFIGNYAKSSSSQAVGGAIYNYNGGTLVVVGDFIGNYASSSQYNIGGAIANVSFSTASADTIIYSITGDFIGNYVSSGANAQGGAIANYVSSSAASTSGYKAIIGTIRGNFIDNYASASYGVIYGGAIYNQGGNIIGDIVGDFINNSAYTTGTSSYAWTYGGAICNYYASSIGDITGDFSNNYVSSLVATSGSNTLAYGGAISNRYEMACIRGDFSNNYVSIVVGTAAGGAIANFTGSSSAFGSYDAIIESIEGSFTGNYVNATSGTAKGGAIYSLGGTSYTDSSGNTAYLSAEVTLTSSEGNNYVNSGNFASTKTLDWNDDGSLATVLDSDDDKNGGFLYMSGSATTNFDTAANSSITIGDAEGSAGYDSIASSDSYSIINKTGEGDLFVNSSMVYYLGDLNVQAGYMYLKSDLSSESTASGNLSVLSGATFELGGTAYVDEASIAGIVLGDISVSTCVTLEVSAGNAGSSIIDGTLSGTYSSASVIIDDIGAALASVGSVLATVDSGSLALSIDTTNGLESDFYLVYDATNYTYTLDVIDTSANVTEGDDIVYDLDSGDSSTNTTVTKDGETSEVTFSTDTDYTLSSNMTVDKTETTNGSTITVDNATLTADSTNDSTIIVGDGATLATGSITSDSSVSVEGGQLVYDNSLSDDESAKTNLIIQNTASSLDDSHEEQLDAAIASVVDGYVGILHADGNIFLTEVSSSQASEYHLEGETTLEAGSDGAVVISGNISIDQTTANSDAIAGDNTLLNISGDLTLVNANLDLSGIDLTVTDDDSAISLGSSTITVGEDETVLSVSGEGITVSGSLTSSTGDDETTSTAITVSNSSGEIAFEDGTVISSDGIALTNYHEVGVDSNGLSAIANGSITFEGDLIANSPLYITAGTYTESTVAVTVKGGTISASGGSEVSIEGLNLILSTNSSGTLANFSDSGTISISEGNSIIVEGSSSMLVGETYLLADDDTVTANADNYDFTTQVLSENGEFDIVEADASSSFLTISSISEGAVYLTVESLSTFANTANTINETALANALDTIEATSNSATNDAMRAFKQEVQADSLGSYIMDNYSQIAEVNSILLSNMNLANVNRARSILEKSAGIQIDDEDGSISFENEDGTISVVDASEVSLIKYSNVAQLQSINILGSKEASNGVAGYDYWSVGSTANFDEILSEKALIGASIGGTYNKVEGDAGNNANSTTFLLNAYAVYAYEGLEVFGNIGYAHFWNEGSNAGAKADWDSDAFNALIGVSYDLETTLEGLTFTPLVMLNLVCLEADSASYSNGVNVDEQSYFSAKLMLGFEVEYAISEQFKVLARAMYMHEMGDASYDFTYGLGYVAGVEYIGSCAGKDAALMGLSLSYDFSETCTAYFDYNAYLYESLTTHSLNLSVALKF